MLIWWEWFEQKLGIFFEWGDLYKVNWEKVVFLGGELCEILDKLGCSIYKKSFNAATSYCKCCPNIAKKPIGLE